MTSETLAHLVQRLAAGFVACNKKDAAKDINEFGVTLYAALTRVDQYSGWRFGFWTAESKIIEYVFLRRRTDADLLISTDTVVPTCRNCKFCVRTAGGNDPDWRSRPAGHWSINMLDCRRHAPQIVSHGSRHPEVHASYWCGDWELTSDLVKGIPEKEDQDAST